MTLLREVDEVGPVLSASPEAAAFLAAIVRLNASARVVERGSYVRVLVPGRCRLTKAAVERECGRALRWPEELEAVMPAFKGRLRVGADEAEWVGRGGEP